MRLGSGRMPLGVKPAFALAVALLLQGVTSMSIANTAATSAPASLSVATPLVADALEKEETLDKNELDANQPKADYEEASRGDDSLEYDRAVSPDKAGPTNSSENTMKEDEERESNAETSPEENRREETNFLEEEDQIDDDDALNFVSLIAKRAVEELQEEELEELMSSDNDALNFIRLVAKRAAEEEEKEEAAAEEGKPVDEDSFLFSDLPQIMGPLLKAFNSAPEKSEAPSPEDFFSWFPDLKKLLEDPSATSPAGRRSYLPTSPQPPLQISPASSQPTGSEDLPSLQETSASTVQPTIPEPPQASQASLPDVPDSEERFH